jgi:uncharacterized protein (DUF427 family)
MRVKLGGMWIADSQDVVLLHEPGRYPVAYFPLGDVSPGLLRCDGQTTQHPELGSVEWFGAESAQRDIERAAWRYTALPPYAAVLNHRVAFVWEAMDGFFEEDERLIGHATDPYHRIDVRAASRHLLVCDGNRVIADTDHPLVLFESGCAPQWYVAWGDVDRSALRPVGGPTLCAYKGLANYYDVGDRSRAAWSYNCAWPEAGRVRDYVTFEPAGIDVFLDGRRLLVDPGQAAILQGSDCGLNPAEALHHYGA